MLKNCLRIPFLAVSILFILLVTGCGGGGGGDGVALVSISVTPDDPTIFVGSSQPFTATGHYSDGSTNDLTTLVTWNSSDTSIATINTSGVASAIAAGSTTISSSYLGVSDSKVLTVLNVVLISIMVTPDDPTILIGLSQQFTATGHYSDGSANDLTTLVTWNSSNTGIATINASGVASAIAAGSTTISSSYLGISDNKALRVLHKLALPKTGQTICYNHIGDIIACAGTGQDGELQEGVAWPDPRFTVGIGSEIACITDNLTGLMWARAPDGTTARSWSGALASANDLTQCGYSDWRLSNRRELNSIIHRGWPNTSTWLSIYGFNVASTDYWTSSTLVGIPDNAWNADMYMGAVDIYDKAGGPRLWSMRTAQIAVPAQTAMTGQITCYDTDGTIVTCANTGQDGDTQAGVAWPSPRFTIGSGAEIACVTDNLTGLMWMGFPDNTVRTWQEALDYANGLDLCGYNDWRLPNVIEQESLINAEQAFSASWLSSLGFSNVQNDFYWTSTTVAVKPANAWRIHLGMGYVSGFFSAKSDIYNAWPVRGR